LNVKGEGQETDDPEDETEGIEERGIDRTPTEGRPGTDSEEG
jgi:hypothetical protein